MEAVRYHPYRRHPDLCIHVQTFDTRVAVRIDRSTPTVTLGYHTHARTYCTNRHLRWYRSLRTNGGRSLPAVPPACRSVHTRTNVGHQGGGADRPIDTYRYTWVPHTCPHVLLTSTPLMVPKTSNEWRPFVTIRTAGMQICAYMYKRSTPGWPCG